jgi:SAM-dependent methyltransferase
MTEVRGLEGYGRAAKRFIELSQALDFKEICSDFLDYLPTPPARILDAGSGAGQNAAALAQMGHSVVAVEPMPVFMEAARTAYAEQDISWVADSLPSLECLSTANGLLDFILVDGVCHHLDEGERIIAIARFRELLTPGGRCALSLRNGPPGLGTLVYPTNAKETIVAATARGFDCLFVSEDQPSNLAGKEDVIWSRIVLQKSS